MKKQIYEKVIKAKQRLENVIIPSPLSRSEERRVGKECGS